MSAGAWGLRGRACRRRGAAWNAGGRRGAGRGPTGGKSSRRGEPGPGADGAEAGPAARMPGGGTRAAVVRTHRVGKETWEHPDHPERTNADIVAHSHAVIALISLNIKGSNCGNLRKKKKKIQLLIWKREREGRGSGSGRGKSCHPTFRLLEPIVVGAGLLRKLRDGHLWGQSGSQPLLPIILWKGASFPLSRIPSPRLHSWNTQFLPTLYPLPSQTRVI